MFARQMESGKTPRVVTTSRPARLLLCCFLAALSLSYLAKGYRNLILTPADLHRRWVECRFVLHGQDPFQVYLHQMHGPDAAFNQRECDRLTAVYGGPEEPVYPPWAYAPAMLFVWAPWPIEPYFYLLVDTACIAMLVAGALAIARTAFGDVSTASDTLPSPLNGWDNDFLNPLLLALGTLAIASICTTLGNGNFGLIVTAAVYLAFWFDQKDKPIVSGIFFWISLIKPTISLPFAVIFLLQRRWKPLLIAACFCAVSCLFPWVIDRINPWAMLQEAVKAAQHFQGGGYGTVNWLARVGVPENRVTPAVAMLVLIPAGIFYAINRSLPLWKNLAILCVIGRFWGYHMAHDNVMLFFLSCAAWRIYLARPGVESTLLMLVVGASLWLPSGLTELGVTNPIRKALHEAVGIFQHLTWLCAAIYIWRWKSNAVTKP